MSEIKQATSGGARDAILARIREALPMEATNLVASYASVPRAFERTGELDSERRLELFLDRLIDYDTEVLQVDAESDLSEAVDKALRSVDETEVLASEEFPASWLPRECAVVLDRQLTIDAMNKIKAVVTTCEAAVASTGTIFLVHSGAQGRRAITLLPDHHICLVRRSQIFEVLPETLYALHEEQRLPITTISGPSATSDIEMTRIRGVHGPRRLTVILYGLF